jgi:hypothetical protein
MYSEGVHRFTFLKATLKVLFEEGPGGEKAKQSGYYPSKPMLSIEEWEKIKHYFNPCCSAYC